ncbi:MAG: hypothetical protein ACPG4T_15180 [Nannocystaceae bacterium]
MKNEIIGIVVAGVFVSLLIWGIGATGGCRYRARQIEAAHDSWRDEAVETGHAEYYLDENNDRQ